MQNVILIFICGLMGTFAAGAFYLAHKESQARKRVEKDLKEAQEHEGKVAEIITQAEKDKSAANTGDHVVDNIFIANKLHEYAKKGQ